jgi:hypothetical protein
MRFKRELVVQGLETHPGAGWHVDLGDEHGITLEFRWDTHPNEDESTAEFSPNTPYLSVTVQGEWQLDSRLEHDLSSLASGSVVSFEAERFELWAPIEAQKAIRSIDHELMDAAGRVTNVVRWRFGVLGEHEPLRGSGLEWQADDGNWRSFRFHEPLRRWSGAEANFGRDVVDELIPLIESKWREPLGHSLLREAWDLRERNPRSALVIGVAAAEVGFKQFAVEMAPQTAWLVEELQSPPLEKLLRNYLPMLLRDEEKFPIKQIPRTIINVIKDAVEKRNTVAHKSPTALQGHEDLQDWLSKDRLDPALLAVWDLLWFLDYYRGYSWALDHLRRETFADWTALSAPR